MSLSLLSAILVGVGGMAGALSRHVVDQQIIGKWSTVTVNVLGSIALGFIVAAPVGDAAATLAGTGFCGAFTTFSSFAVGVAELLDVGDYRTAARYAFGTLLAALVGVAIGAAVGGILG
ncbi:CrcB family protein [Haloferax mediterranei ATCC 33500]|uniref:Fluoride-specific ion channel FluC n=1 Tax=Haloferax mediterranei (strain ATCC 33500 / DSM 1411 / JCM 8866 / NBRC 14739 / NCIMB 2177 / R-4) TaxID=523841 RepID=I3R1F7_HALMT|nr:CrcB family protein [Haloferax mediterranei]AFK18067.1 CRCB integral membrane protein [Haloferax mediterranei ATCC 33500]AHZ22520.1 camphor resistance protein CrcB [Haloferax mediterranei ATCC 33500]EMA02657.1 CRCB integral membrane protein [Haloferax mediterranei ATCC 33500]MDX5988160.1 CrcB family protein [Haloferax mediterranei ATCC 33500]QCQ74607.1 CrcB family protein [Haloferax mediterranei ATCC 33500]